MKKALGAAALFLSSFPYSWAGRAQDAEVKAVLADDGQAVDISWKGLEFPRGTKAGFYSVLYVTRDEWSELDLNWSNFDRFKASFEKAKENLESQKKEWRVVHVETPDDPSGAAAIPYGIKVRVARASKMGDGTMTIPPKEGDNVLALAWSMERGRTVLCAAERTQVAKPGATKFPRFKFPALSVADVKAELAEDGSSIQLSFQTTQLAKQDRPISYWVFYITRREWNTMKLPLLGSETAEAWFDRYTVAAKENNIPARIVLQVEVPKESESENVHSFVRTIRHEPEENPRKPLDPRLDVKPSQGDGVVVLAVTVEKKVGMKIWGGGHANVNKKK